MNDDRAPAVRIGGALGGAVGSALGAWLCWCVCKAIHWDFQTALIVIIVGQAMIDGWAGRRPP